MSHRFTQHLFFFLFLAGIFLPSTIVFAAKACACYSTDKNCVEVTLGAGKQSQATCEAACIKKLEKANFASAQYSSGLAGEATTSEAVIFKCTQARSLFEKSKAAPSSPTAPGSAPPIALMTPTLNIDIPGVSFTSAVSEPCTSEPGAKCVKSNFLSEYLTGLFRFLITISITIAIVMVMVGGIEYTLGAGQKDLIEKGKKRINNAVIGLVLLLGVYLTMYTVNPQLTILKTIELQNVPALDMPEIDEGDVVPEGQSPPSGGLPTPGRLCHSIEACKKICGDKSALDKYNIQVPLLVNSTGFKNSGKAKGTANLQNALKEAGMIAVSINPSYVLEVPGSECGYRSVLAQVKKACDDIDKNGGNSLTHGILAWPGGSNHGSGVAIDIQLTSGGKNLMTMSAKAQSDPKFQSPAETLAKIMKQAGFVRYGKEIWHFELKGGSFCRCSYPNCPFPPHC